MPQVSILRPGSAPSAAPSISVIVILKRRSPRRNGSEGSAFRRIQHRHLSFVNRNIDALAFLRIRNTRKAIMRLRIGCAPFAVLYSAVFAFAQPPAPTCADLHIVPRFANARQYRSVQLSAETENAHPSLPIRQESAEKPLNETRFAVEDLAQHFSDRGINTKSENAQGISFAPVRGGKGSPTPQWHLLRPSHAR